MTRRVTFTPEAIGQLDAIFDYVAGQSGSARAISYTDRILATCASLAFFPERGSARDDLAPGLRVVGMRRQATIAFSIYPDLVVVEGILAGGRDVDGALRGIRTSGS